MIQRNSTQWILFLFFQWQGYLLVRCNHGNTAALAMLCHERFDELRNLRKRRIHYLHAENLFEPFQAMTLRFEHVTHRPGSHAGDELVLSERFRLRQPFRSTHDASVIWFDRR